jgi:beta-galactosidase
VPAPGRSWLHGRLCYGGDYNPEQWPERVWVEDVALMREAGVNLVSVGVFAWSRLEPREGEYDFAWLDRVLDLLADAGVKAAIATPTASPPPWFSFAHPEALPVNRDGVRLQHGSRDTYCASAPAYREAAVRIATALGRRYAEHPALALWHVHNEYGTVCYCDLVAASFRDWLRERYGTLERLNEAWTTAFWSQSYTDWGHILPPRTTQYLPNPTQLLDFRRFFSDELLGCFRDQRDVLREITPGIPVTTNFVLGSWVPVDHARWAREVDLVTIDHYPSSADPLRAEQETAFAADRARGWARDRPWLLLEQAPNLIYTALRMVPKVAGQLARLSLSHVGRGSTGAMFFQWRAPRGGAEMFHAAAVGHAGADTRIFREVVELGGVLDRIREVEGEVRAEVAVAWHAPSWWALQGPGLPSAQIDYDDVVSSVHASLWRAGITADVIDTDDDLTAYRLLLVPSLYLVSAATAAALETYVRAGGCLVVWFLSGIADEDNQVWLGGYPGALRDVLGVRVDEWYPTAEVALSTGGRGLGWSESVHSTGAEIVATYASGPLVDRPAVTRHRLGDGTAWYISTRMDDETADRFLPALLDSAGLAHLAGQTGAGLEVIRRHSPAGDWVFAINHRDSPAQLAICGHDLVTDRAVAETVKLEPGGYAVVRESP